jgi:hypothetical protein
VGGPCPPAPQPFSDSKAAAWSDAPPGVTAGIYGLYAAPAIGAVEVQLSGCAPEIVWVNHPALPSGHTTPQRPIADQSSALRSGYGDPRANAQHSRRDVAGAG